MPASASAAAADMPTNRQRRRRMAKPSTAAANPTEVCGLMDRAAVEIPPATSLFDHSDSAAPAVNAKPNVANCPSAKVRANGSVATTSRATSGHENRPRPASSHVQLMPRTAANTASDAQSVAAAGSGSAPNGARAMAVHGGYASLCPQRSSAFAGGGGIVMMAGAYCRASYGSPPLATIRPAAQKQ